VVARNLDSFMATMVAASAPVSCDDAVKLARDYYGLDATATRLTGERDENFKLSCLDGRHYVLKIASAAEAAEVTDLPTAALLHVERVDPGFPCPRVLRNVDGLTQSSYRDASGSQRTARILTYLPGKTMRSSVRSREQRSACGRIAARLGVALRGFSHPAAARPLIWDLKHVGRTLALLDDLGAFPAKDVVAALISRIDDRIQAEFGSLRQQVVHNDMNDMNVLVDPDDEDAVVGIIDFGDLVHTALVADVAILAADQIDAERGARDSINDVVMAYHATTPLLPQELALLNPLIAGRLLADVVIASWHRRQNPAGTHYANLSPDFLHARVQLAAEVFALEAYSPDAPSQPALSPNACSPDSLAARPLSASVSSASVLSASATGANAPSADLLSASAARADVGTADATASGDYSTGSQQ
jgi:hydroxylysine kinase